MTLLIFLLIFFEINNKNAVSSINNLNFPESTINEPINDKVYNFKDLFNVGVYRLNVNTSSPCNYTGNQLLLKCHIINEFNENSYKKAINEYKIMIINQLGLKSKTIESIPKQKKARVTFLKEIETKFGNKSKETVKETVFDKTKMQNKILNLIHNVEGKFL